MKLKQLGLIFVSLVFSMTLVSLAYADVTTGPPSGSITTGPAPTQSVSPTPTGGSVQVLNPLGVTSICGLIKGVLNGALAIGIPIAVLFIVYAGFKFVVALGNPEKLKEARQNLLYTVIGIAIFLGAWLLSQVIINTVNQLQQGSTNPTTLQSC